MEATDYNGWTNRETWIVNLWVGNDEFVYKMMRRLNLIDAERCKSFVLKIIPRYLLNSIVNDLGSFEKLSNVNWEELAEHWNEK